MSGNQSGADWDWKRSTETGYSYPSDAHLMTVNRDARHPGDIPPWPTRTPTAPPLAPFRIAVALAAAAAIAVVGGALLTTSPAEPHATATAVAIASTTNPADAGNWPGNPGQFTAPTKTLDPYADTGDWLVGPDLPAGVYRVQVTGPVGGYIARCADTQCAIGAGLLANDVLSPGDTTVLDIRPTDYMVKTAGVRLIPA